MARASGLALVDAVATIRCARSTRGTGELIAARDPRSGARRVIVGVGGSATTDGGLAAVEALGWSLGGIDGDGRVRRRRRRSSTPRRVYGPQKGATDAQVALLTRRLDAARRPVPSSAPASTCARSTAAARPAGSPAGSPRSARELEPGLRRRRRRGRARGRARRRRPRGHRRGQARRHELRRARSSAACSSGRPTLGVPRIAA